MNERVARGLFWVWMAVFAAGAAAELLGLAWLRELVDVKQLFLR